MVSMVEMYLLFLPILVFYFSPDSFSLPFLFCIFPSPFCSLRHCIIIISRRIVESPGTFFPIIFLILSPLSNFTFPSFFVYSVLVCFVGWPSVHCLWHWAGWVRGWFAEGKKERKVVWFACQRTFARFLLAQFASFFIALFVFGPWATGRELTLDFRFCNERKRFSPFFS